MQILIDKSEGKTPLGNLRRIWEANRKTVLKEIECEFVERII